MKKENNHFIEYLLCSLGIISINIGLFQIIINAQEKKDDLKLEKDKISTFLIKVNDINKDYDALKDKYEYINTLKEDNEKKQQEITNVKKEINEYENKIKSFK